MNFMADTGIFIKMTLINASNLVKLHGDFLCLKINPIDWFTYISKWQRFTYFLESTL